MATTESIDFTNMTADDWREFDEAFAQCLRTIAPDLAFNTESDDDLQALSDVSQDERDAKAAAAKPAPSNPRPAAAAPSQHPAAQCINHGDPAADRMYLMTAAPPTASGYDDKPADEPRALTETLFKHVTAAYKKAHGSIKITAIAAITVDKEHQPQRTGIRLNQAQIKAAFADAVSKVCPQRRACFIRTLDELKKLWAKCRVPLLEYLGDDKDATERRAPMVYDPGEAMTVNFLYLNIEYRETTYCLACRHRTYRFDVHYWCMPCTILAGYWPCTGESNAATCRLCHDLPTAIRKNAKRQWRKLYKDGQLQYDVIAQLPSRLPWYIATHYDANVCQVLLARNRGIKDVQPVLPTLAAETKLAQSYNIQFDPPATPGKDLRKPSDKAAPKPSTSSEPQGSDSSKNKRTSSGRVVKQTSQYGNDSDDDAAFQRARLNSLKKKKRNSGSDGLPPSKKSSATTTTDADKAAQTKAAADALAVQRPADETLRFPWDYLDLVLRGEAGLDNATFHGEKTNERGYVASFATSDQVYQDVRQMWLGRMHIKTGIPRGSAPGTWCIIVCSATTPGVCETPFLPCPKRGEKVEIPKPDLGFQPPAEYDDIMDTATIDWPELLQNRLLLKYRPTFGQLQHPESWSPLLLHPQPSPPYMHISRTSVVFPTMDRELKWSDVMQFSNDALLDLLKGNANVQPNVISFQAFSHSWWRQIATPGTMTSDLTIEQPLMTGLLMPDHSQPQTLLTPEKFRRPVIPNSPDVPEVTHHFGGLTVTAKTYIEARQDEQAALVRGADAEHLLDVTYRSRRMHIPVTLFDTNSDAAFPARALQIPDARAWKPRLATPLDAGVAYPVTDLALRYMEELTRVHMYQTSLREYALHRTDRDLQDLLGIIALFAQGYRKAAKRIVREIVARLWQQTVDDVALTAEMLATVIHARRQGFLSLATPHLTADERRCALTMPFMNQERILTLPTADDIANMNAVLPANTDATETMSYDSQGDQEL